LAATVDLVITPRERDLGEFTVRRSLPHARRRLVGPFIFFDHMGPAEFPPGQGMNVRAHPHIGLATITYLFDGRIRHRDSLGFDQEITPGAVNWMTAGRGIVHSERTPPALVESGSSLHGIQTWVALPIGSEECSPAFDHYAASEIPAVTADGADLRVIMGSAFGATSPVRTASETLYAELRLKRGKALAIDARAEELALYVVSGTVRVDGQVHGEGTLLVAAPGAEPTLSAVDDALVMLLGGATIEGHRSIWWNFVSSSRERLEQAKDDWRNGRFDMIEGESEFIPLPED